MSGLLRRIKRSRTADAGEPLPEGQAAAPEGAPTTAETAAVAPAPAPVLVVDPAVPAGLDPAETPLRPPAGRRGRLRRRLRYLRRARELMLRDLGGLLYEVHRTAAGRIDAHVPVVNAKVERIAALDAEAHAIEAALSVPRAEAVVFQPGIGGTCAACGELYGSSARFCSNCAAPTGAPAPEAPAPVMPPAPAMPAAPGAEAKTSVLPAERTSTAPTSDMPATPTDETGERPAHPSGKPYPGLSNGREDDHTPPGLSSGDPLVTRESHP